MLLTESHFHHPLHSLSHAPSSSPLAHSQHPCTNTGISVPRPQMNPSTATGNLRGWDNPSPPHMLRQLMLLTSKGLSMFFLLSKVMANDWPGEILYLKLWNLSRALHLTPSTVLCSCSLFLCCISGGWDLQRYRSLFQQEMQSAADFPEVLVSANLPSHFLPQDSNSGRAFPQDCLAGWKHTIMVRMMHTVWGAESLPGRAWWWAVRWCKYILALASSCFSLLGKNYSAATISIVNVTTATTWLHSFSGFISNVILKLVEIALGCKRNAPLSKCSFSAAYRKQERLLYLWHEEYKN